MCTSWADSNKQHCREFEEVVMYGWKGDRKSSIWKASTALYVSDIIPCRRKRSRKEKVRRGIESCCAFSQKSKASEQAGIDGQRSEAAWGNGSEINCLSEAFTKYLTPTPKGRTCASVTYLNQWSGPWTMFPAGFSVSLVSRQNLSFIHLNKSSNKRRGGDVLCITHLV